MKVWIVTAEPYHDNSTILGVYASEAKAEEMAETLRHCREDVIRRADEAIVNNTPFPEQSELDHVLQWSDILEVTEQEVLQ